MVIYLIGGTIMLACFGASLLPIAVGWAIYDSIQSFKKNKKEAKL